MASLAETVVAETADWGAVAMVNERGRVEQLHVAATDPALRDAAEELEGLPTTWFTRAPAVRAALRPEADPAQPYPIDRESLAGRTTRDQLAVLERLGLGTALVVPLRARERPLGVIMLVRRGASFAPEHVATAGHVAHLAGLSLENVRLFERERTVALTLQRRLLPEVPHVDGLDVAATYLPAQHPAEVGGDWFDVLALPDGATGLAVGDVVGHDMSAAASMGQLRSVLRSYAWSGEPAGRVIERLDELVRGLGMADVATCVYLRLADGHLEYSRAGHPSPAVLLPTGAVRTLDGGLRTPVGVRSLTSVTAQAEADLPVGATLVAYSDGLVERRDRGLREGLLALHVALAAAPAGAGAGAIRDHLIDALAPTTTTTCACWWSSASPDACPPGSDLAGRPPVAKCLLRVGRVLRAALHAQLEQEAVRLADLTPGADAKDRHNLRAVQVRPDRRELLLLAQLADPVLQVVVGEGELIGLAAVARGGVRTGQPVQSLEQRPGIGDVATHGRVGPRLLAVAVEAQVQLGEPGDGLDRVLVEPQRRRRLATSLAPTTSWWWKLTPPPGSNRRVAGLPMSCSSAARRSTRSGPGTGPVGCSWVPVSSSIAWASTVKECW